MRGLITVFWLVVSPLMVQGEERSTVDMVWIERPESEQSVRINATTFDVLRNYLKADVSIIEANTARALHMLSGEAELACRGDLRKTPERTSQYPSTTLPQVVYPSLRLFSHEPLEESPVSLAYLKSLKKVLPLQMHRDYGFDTTSLDGGALMVMATQTKVGPDNAIKLFNHKRADLLIEYPSVYDTYTPPQSDKEHYIYPIEGQAPMALGYIMCSDTPAGREMVQRFDDIIRKASQTRAFLEAHQQWFHEFDVTPLYNQVFATQFQSG